MNFNEAYQKMLEGKKIKRPDWKGYWFIDSKDNKFKIKLAGGEIKENKFTQETIKNTAADDWEVMEELKSKVWKPNIGENYFFITSSLEVNKFTNEGDMVDESIISSYNCFKTEEEAQHMIEKLKVIKELQNFAIENRDEEISWDKDDEYSHYKYCIYFDYRWESIRINFTTVAHDSPFNIYFTSKEIAQKAIDPIGEERIKKYYFDIEV